MKDSVRVCGCCGWKDGHKKNCAADPRRMRRDRYQDMLSRMIRDGQENCEKARFLRTRLQGLG